MQERIVAMLKKSLILRAKKLGTLNSNFPLTQLHHVLVSSAEAARGRRVPAAGFSVCVPRVVPRRGGGRGGGARELVHVHGALGGVGAPPESETEAGKKSFLESSLYSAEKESKGSYLIPGIIISIF